MKASSSLCDSRILCIVLRSILLFYRLFCPGEDRFLRNVPRASTSRFSGSFVFWPLLFWEFSSSPPKILVFVRTKVKFSRNTNTPEKLWLVVDARHVPQKPRGQLEQSLAGGIERTIDPFSLFVTIIIYCISNLLKDVQRCEMLYLPQTVVGWMWDAFTECLPKCQI